MVLRLISRPDPPINLVIPPLVEEEWNDNIDTVSSEITQNLSKLDSQIGVVHTVASALFRNLRRIKYSKLNVVESLTTVSRGLLAHGISLDMDDVVSKQATGRAIALTPPATKGAIKDCIIYMHCLELFSRLRMEGFKANCVFMTSNTKDFCEKTGTVREPVRSELQERSVGFVKSWPEVMIALGIRKKD
jgi:hypothetical protein